MDLGTKTANNLLSKDFKVAQSACCDLINHKDFETFKTLVKNQENIFPFLKDKINKNLVKNVTKENHLNILAFTTLYTPDFEEFIVNGLVKFADEDLTDIMLDKLEGGTIDEKTYAASYFCQINDTLAIEDLNKYALYDNEYLAYNCAKALCAFDDKELYNIALEKIADKNEKDEFENLKYIDFLINYGDKNGFEPIFDYMKNSIFSLAIGINLLNLKSYKELTKENNINFALEIFNKNLEAYPEELPLETLTDYEILDFMEYIINVDKKSALISALILKANLKFEMFRQNDIYTYNLTKDTKEYLGEICKLLNSKDENFYNDLKENLLEAFNEDEPDVLLDALEVISEFKIESYADTILKKLEETDNDIIICECAKTLKNLGAVQNINKDLIEQKLKNENSKALFESYLV